MRSHFFVYWELMQSLKADRLLNALRSADFLASHAASIDPNQVIPSVRAALLENLNLLRDNCDGLSLFVSRDFLDNLLRIFDAPEGLTIRSRDVADQIRNIAGILESELSRRQCFIVSADHAKYCEGASLFGVEVNQKYQVAVYDLDEAATCMALARSTAAIFHLMRVMEIALRAVYHCLGITEPLTGNGRNWGTIGQRILDNIKGRGSTFAEKDVFLEMHGFLWVVKDAWRNATMHIENKYTEDEAEHIFIAVQGFMKKVAVRMGQDGLPLA